MATGEVIEAVADNIEEVAVATRHINPGLVKYFLGGVGVGAAIGFFIGYRYNREKIKALAFAESEAEIEVIREHYRSKEAALENEQGKRELTDIIENEEYTTESIRVVDSVVDLRSVDDVEPERPLPAPVPIDSSKRVFRSTEASKDKMEGWNFPRELAGRASDRAHIIHQDEFALNETEYAQVTYVYYAGDDVLVDEDKTPLAARDEVVVRNFEGRFGHGSDDHNILYVRNPVLELDIEICRTPGSYEEDVLGLEREPSDDTVT